MALNKVTTFQSQVRANSTSETPVVKSTRITDNQVVRIANIPLSDNNITVRKTTNSNEFYASKLLNYVESVNISGFPKTVFYSELATNFNIGDRVYILNGFYDSADFISKDKYTKFTDGYRVLGVDGCRIILDLDYTGQLPYTDFKLEDLIFVHHITSQAQFDYVNSVKMASDLFNVGFYSNFSAFGNRNGEIGLIGNSMIFISGSFSSSTDLNISNSGIDLTIPGFYVKSTDHSTWYFVSSNFKENNITYTKSNVDENRMIVIGDDFVFEGKTYKERLVYKFDILSNEWIFDKEYKQPVISKLNFRYGNFKGVHNDGVFGSYDRVPSWNNATWNSGFFVNSSWNLGTMTNKSKTEKSYSSKLTIKTGSTQSVAIQNVDFSNNRGFGYNYVIDSVIKSANITRGNFENTNIGTTSSQTNVVSNYYDGFATFSVISDYGNYNFCDINTTYISNASISDSILDNSHIFKSKSVNNQLVDSVADNVQYNSDGGLNILAADLWGHDPTEYLVDSGGYNNRDFTTIRGTLKLFISDKDFLRLEKGDSFYLEKINKEYYINSLTTDDKIQLPIETRYILDYYTDYELFYGSGTSKVSVSLKPKTNNYLKHYISSEIEPGEVTITEPSTLKYTMTFREGGLQVVGSFSYWKYIESYKSGEWSENERYSYEDYILYENDLYVFTGLTGNEMPINPPVGDYYAWDYVTASPPIYNSTITNAVGDYVFSLSTKNNGSTYSLFICLISTSVVNQLGRVMPNSILTSKINTDVRVKKLVIEDSDIKYSSIDIDSDSFGWYEDIDGSKKYIDQTSGISKVPINFINRSFVNTNIKASDMRSGVFVNSTWQSGYNVNYYGGIIKKSLTNTLNISSESDQTLRVSLENNPHSYQYSIRGLDFKKGDSVWLSGVSYTGTSSEVSLDGRYVIVNDPIKNVDSDISLDVTIKPEFITASFSSLSKTYSVFGAEGNTYTTLSKLSIENSTINYGFFRRTHLKDTVISNDQFDNQDTEFKLNNINLLRLVNLLSKDNNLTINDGIFYRSHFVNGNFNLGIVHNSVWNGNTFSNGLFSAGSWQSGNFISGKFIDSNGTASKTDYHDSREFYKNWSGGTFQTGEFINSAWLNGTFNNGKFYNSHFYGGVWNNGILGSKNLNMMNTSFGYYPKLDGIGTSQSIWNNGVVENAIMGGDGIVYWYDGKFNSGEFTSNGTTSENESIWYNGEFNGSKITKLARWKNGIFNSGKFWSYYGWENVGPTSSSNNPSDYSWENGKFKSGEFGYKGLTSNSVWYNGQFYGGQFVGRFWKNGYFLSGNFFGSGLTSGINSASSSLDEYKFTDSYTFSYYGLWNDGYVVENIKSISGEEGVLLNQKRAVQIGSKPDDKTTFNNILWLGGTFSHNNAVINDSLWLYGSFAKGDFNGGVFNPYVDRDFTGSFSNSSFGTHSIWYDGTFLTGSFWSSEWKRGTFKNGYMSGAKWTNGVWEYGTADNICWLNGTWRNGNWNGSPYDYRLISTASSTYSMISGREKDVILRVSDYITSSTTQSNIHLLNIFSVSNVTSILTEGFTNSNSWTYSNEIYTGSLKTGGTDFKPILTQTYLNKSSWSISNGFRLVDSTQPGSLITSTSSIIVEKPKAVKFYTDSNIVTSGGQNSYYTNLGYSGYNIYSNPGSNPDVPPSSKLYAYKGGTTSFFTDSPVNYSIKLTVVVELVQTVEVECFVGSMASSVFKLDSDVYHYSELITSGAGKGSYKEYYDYRAKVYTISLSYNTSASSLSLVDGKKFAIRKTSNGILRILKAEVTKRNVEYHPTYNNELYLGVNKLTKNVEFPSTYSVALNTITTNGILIGSNFGNGVFRSGTWENGVWNNGYRSSDWFGDSDIIKASDVVSKKTYKISQNTWLVTIKCYDTLNNFNINYKISVGNIVNIDINGNRNFLRDPLRVSKVDTNNKEISFLYVSNFEIREIKKDSPNHLIYITQNIWQNGVFLNGYFNGIWGNGVFKGYPKTTEMVDSHWINGYFEGGHFKSITLVENRNEGLPEYNTGLIQNITFKDRNIANAPSNSYESWIDVNYSTQSNVNLNIYSTMVGVSLKNTNKVVESFLPNKSGYPTSDVLTSDAYFRNSKTSYVGKYSLSSLYTIYSDLLSSIGEFRKPFVVGPASNALTGNELKIAKKVGGSNFKNDGWTYSVESTMAQELLRSNVNTETDGNFQVFFPTFVDDYEFTITFDNSKIITKPNRYYAVEVILTSKQTGGLLNITLNDTSTGQIDDVFPHEFRSKTSAIEYFYNKKSLDMSMGFDAGDPGMSASIDRISFYEVDSIPFFKYYKTNEIDLSIKNPYIGIAPVIDYTNKNFDFIGNIELGIDYRTIVQQNSSVANQSSSSTNKNGSAFSEKYIKSDDEKGQA